jgi:hypothetical protein
VSTLAAALLAACTGTPSPRRPADASPAPPPAPAPASTSTAPSTSAPAADDRFLNRDVSEVLATLRTAPFESARELGGISLSFKVELAGGTTCSFKPEVRGQRQRWQGEVAAWRLARLAGLAGTMPPSESRRVRRDELLGVLEHDERTTAARDRLVHDVPWDADGTAPGSVTYWIPGAAPRAIERETEWKGWLSQSGAVDASQRALAAALSNLLVFDYVIGNWDRMSGGGFLTTEDGARLWNIDHNAAFYRPMPDEARERLESHFRLVERFGRGLLARLRAFDAPSIRRALEADGGGQPILSDDQIADVLARRDALLSRVDALAAAHGEAAVLAFE